MAKTVFDNGLLKINVRYLSTNKNGLFFYYRRIPQELRAHHGNRTFIRKSLKTREVHLAAKRAAVLAAEHDALWTSLRSQDGRDLALTTPENRNAAKALLETLGLAPGDAHRPPDNHMDPHPTEFIVDYLQDRYGDEALEAQGHYWQALRCSVPEYRDAILTRESEDALWQVVFTAAPAQRREFEPSSKRRKRRPASSPSVTA